MRMSFSLFLLFIPITLHADCYHDYNGNPEGCKNAAGCYWYSLASTCADCPKTDDSGQGYYCPGSGAANQCPGWDSNGGRCPCPSAFPNSNTGTIYETNCYRACDSGNSDPNSTINYTDDCGLTLGDYGSTDETPPIICIENGVINSDIYHVERDFNNPNPTADWTTRCFLNERPCELFNNEFSDNPNATISGTAHWAWSTYSSRYYYNTNDCSVTVESNNINETAHCKTTAFYKYQDGPSNEGLAYDPGSGTNTTILYELKNYYCNECQSKYYPTTTTPNGMSLCGAPQSGDAYRVCSCHKIDDGYYTTCNPWTINTPRDSCAPSRCPAGKTSVDATSINECHYSADTKFCDANGCFNITNANNSNIWTWSY